MWRFLEKRTSALKEVTAIQESNCKRINSQQLFKDFKVYEENLSRNTEDLRLNRGYVYSQVSNVFEDVSIIDMAVDGCGTLYLIDQVKKGEEKQYQEQNLYRFHANEKILEKIAMKEKILSLALRTISAIGVDKDTIYIADYQPGIDESRLIAFTKNELQIRWSISTDPQGKPLSKILAIQPDNRGKIYVLEGDNKRILYIKTCECCDPAFRPFLTLNLEKGDFKPQSLTVGIDGTLYVLFVKVEENENDVKNENNENNQKTANDIKGYILKVELKNKERSVEQRISVRNFSPSGIAVDPQNQIFLSESKTNGSLAIHKLSNDSADEWIPLTIRFLLDETPIKAGQKLICDPKGNLYVLYNNKLILLNNKELNLQNSKGYFEGTYISKPIDSQTSKTRWHRLLLEGDFEKGTQTDFLYYVSDVKLSDDTVKNLDFKNWHKCLSKTSEIQGNKKRDALFIDYIQGRYLWFKIILSGNEILSPVIKSITVFFPRVSYLDYLPGIYQEDPVSKELLERFLAIFESIFYEIDFTIDHIARYFDADGAPHEFLSWLGSWLDVSMDEDWPEEKKRAFIRNAISLYKKRGTRECLEESIKLFTGKKPFVVERFQAFKGRTGSISKSSNKEETISLPFQERIFFPPTDLRVKECPEKNNKEDEGQEELLINKLYGNERFSFYVLLADPDLDTTSQSRVKRIIDEQKPAHTSYELKVLEPFFYLDMHTYLEVNTVVTEPKFIIEKTSIIGRDTVLYDEEKAGQIERHSRVGVDILLS